MIFLVDDFRFIITDHLSINIGYNSEKFTQKSEYFLDEISINKSIHFLWSVYYFLG